MICEGLSFNACSVWPSEIRMIWFSCLINCKYLLNINLNIMIFSKYVIFIDLSISCSIDLRCYWISEKKTQLIRGTLQWNANIYNGPLKMLATFILILSNRIIHQYKILIWCLDPHNKFWSIVLQERENN